MEYLARFGRVFVSVINFQNQREAPDDSEVADGLGALL